MNINYIDSLKESLKNFDSIKNKLNNLEGPGKYIVPQIFENFINEFKFQNDENLSNEEKKYLLRAKLAKWHCDQKRYAMAAININEAIVDFIMDVLNFPIKDTKTKTSETDLAKIWLEKIEKVDISLPVAKALAQKYLNINCSVMSPNNSRLRFISDMIDEYEVDGVLEIILQACHTFSIESYNVKKAVVAKGIPYIKIETDYSKADVGQINTRLEAFLETIAI